MPIYEFFCPDCNTLFNFFSRTINTSKTPTCPRCNQRPLERQMSAFAFTGRAQEADDGEDLPFDESAMEKAMRMVASEADRIDEDDPRQAANLMRKLTDLTGMQLGDGLQEALRRMESGEDPEQVEAEIGDLLESEDPFTVPEKKGRAGGPARPQPERDETLYDL